MFSLISIKGIFFILLSAIVIGKSSPSNSVFTALQSAVNVVTQASNYAGYLTNRANLLKTESGVPCMLCQVAIALVNGLMDANMTDAQITQFVVNLCTWSGLETSNVCNGTTQSLLMPFLYVYKTVKSNISGENICGFIVDGGCIYPNYFLSTFNWQVPMPSPNPINLRPAPIPNTSSYIRIVHMSDTHWDKDYAEGAIVNCNQPFCCRANLTASSTPIMYSGKYGVTVGKCDIPKITLESMLQFLTNNLTFDYVYWTGDIPPHDIWEQTRETNLDDIQSTCDVIKSAISANNTIFPTCGNHEAEAIDRFPVPLAYKVYNISYLYEKLSDVWGAFVPNINKATVLKGGYYSFDLRQGLRVISLNMNYCLRGNFFLLMQSQDPTNQLEWLVQQLNECEQNNIKVHILGHIPPGWCAYVWARNYHDILLRYNSTITGHFYGHTHHDEFEVIYDNNNPPNPISVAFIGPSITTYPNLNPAFRIYTVDIASLMIVDYEEYYLNIDKANSLGIANWELLYTAKDAYNMPDLSAKSYDDLINRMGTNDTLFKTFNNNYYRGGSNASCTGQCKSDLLCSLKIDWPGRNTTCSGGFSQIFK